MYIVSYVHHKNQVVFIKNTKMPHFLLQFKHFSLFAASFRNKTVLICQYEDDT